MQVRLAMGLDPFVESARANSPLNAANHNHILSLLHHFSFKELTFLFISIFSNSHKLQFTLRGEMVCCKIIILKWTV